MEEILHHLIGRLSRYLQGLIHLSWCRISAINSIMQLARLQLSQLATSPSALCQLLSCHADSSGEHRNMSVDQVASPASIHTVYFSISSGSYQGMAPCGSVQAIGSKLGSCKSWRPVSSPIQIQQSISHSKIRMSRRRTIRSMKGITTGQARTWNNQETPPATCIIILPTQTMQTCRGRYIYREIPPKKKHTFIFALCDFPKIGNLMTADMAHRKKKIKF